MDDLNERLVEVFRDVFDDESLEIRDQTVAADVEEWDSLNHLKLVVAIEKQFGVKFSNREIGSWQNVGDIKQALASKLKPLS